MLARPNRRAHRVPVRPRLPARTELVAVLLAPLACAACQYSTTPAAAPPTQPTYPPGAYGTAPYPGQYPVQPGQYPPPAATTPGQPPAAQPPVGPDPAAANDPINRVDLGWLRARSQEDYTALVAALGAGPKSRVQGIPLVVDDTPGDVNAFAACTESGKAIMAITDGLLEITAYLARCAATDEIFGTRKADEYIQFLAQNQRPNQPVARPAASFFTPAQDLDGRKVIRQHQLYDEQIGFILGHEMGHHYLGHLPCTAGNVSASEVGVVLTSVVPAFNQVNETGADTAGVHNVLNAGRVRADYHWNEGGALLTMRFFAGMDQWSPVDILFAFESTHPPPQVRTPIIQQTAAGWRATGGAPLPWLL